MSKRRLFISQPFTGYDETTIQTQRKVLHKVFSAVIGEKPENVELINQLTPDDSYDVRGNFRSDKEQDLYRFCRSISLLGKATDFVLYGDWENSRGCKLEVEIMKQFGIHIIDQKNLITFCIKNNMLSELKFLWPEEAEKLKGIMTLKSIPTTMVSVPALSSVDVADDEIVISYASTLTLGTNVYALRFPAYDGRILELHPKITRDITKFPEVNEHPDLVYVSPVTALILGMDIDQWGDVINLIIPQQDTNEPSYELENEDPDSEVSADIPYPLCIIYDRYSGTYSGGEWVAFNCTHDDVPINIAADDVTCAEAWASLKKRRDEGKILYGVGDTPEDAINDLNSLLE